MLISNVSLKDSLSFGLRFFVLLLSPTLHSNPVFCHFFLLFFRFFLRLFLLLFLFLFFPLLFGLFLLRFFRLVL
jgi:hypothetical protein